MPQSLSAVYIHLVFSTKHRQPFLRDESLRISCTRFSEELPSLWIVLPF